MSAVLRWSWWIIFPAFALLVVRVSVERACADPYNLLPTAMSRPSTGWAIALLYVAAHVWILAAYLRGASSTGTSWAWIAALRIGSGGELWKAVLIGIALAAEYVPVSLWRMAGAATCGGA